MLNNYWFIKGKEILTEQDAKESVYGFILKDNLSECSFDQDIIYRKGLSDDEILSRINKYKLSYQIFERKKIERPVIFSKEVDNLLNDIIIENNKDLDDYDFTETNMDILLKKLKENFEIKLKGENYEK